MLSEVLEDNKSFRFDSEYFKKEYLALQKQIYNYPHEQLGAFSKVTDGEHGSVVFQENGVKYLTAENIKKGIVDISNIRYVTKEVDERNKRASVKVGDILISIKGTLGEVAIAEPWLLPANMNRDVAIIKNKYKNDFLDGYIVLFLMSKIGNKLSERLGSGGVQQMITLERLRTIMIPKLSNSFQNHVSSLYDISRKKLEDSKILYKKAEILLLKELDLLDFEPTKENTSIKSFSESFGSSGRLDSEYYLPKYDEVIDKIKSYKCGFEKLNNILLYISTGEYSENYYKERKGLSFYIRSTNIRDGLVQKDVSHFVNSSNFTRFVKEGDIVTARVGTLGIFGTIDSFQNNSIYSDNVLCFRLPTKYNPYVYTLFLNSTYNKLLIDRLARGSVQQRLNQETLKELLVPIIDPSIQTQIENKIKESFRLKEESKELLELAKRGVEVAIEEGEEVAMKFIEKGKI